MQIDYSQILTAVLIAVLPPLAVSITRWIWARGSELFADLRETRPAWAAALSEGARIAVYAAEQAHVKELIDDKKRYAIEVVQAYLYQAGFPNIQFALVEAEVEKAVFSYLNDYGKKIQ